MIKVLGPDGTPYFEVDNAVEALELRKGLYPNGAKPSKAKPRLANPVIYTDIGVKAPLLVESVVGNLKPETRAFLKALLKAGDWIATKKLAEQLGISVSALGGLSGDLSKQATGAGLALSDFVERDKKGSGDKRQTLYKAGKLLTDQPKLFEV